LTKLGRSFGCLSVDQVVELPHNGMTFFIEKECDVIIKQFSTTSYIAFIAAVPSFHG